MSPITLTFHADQAPLDSALSLLAEVSKHSFEVVDGFLSGLDTPAQLVRVYVDGDTAAGTRDFRVVLQPSDCFVEFLAAFRTGERDDV